MANYVYILLICAMAFFGIEGMQFANIQSHTQVNNLRIFSTQKSLTIKHHKSKKEEESEILINNVRYNYNELFTSSKHRIKAVLWQDGILYSMNSENQIGRKIEPFESKAIVTPSPKPKAKKSKAALAAKIVEAHKHVIASSAVIMGLKILQGTIAKL